MEIAIGESLYAVIIPLVMIIISLFFVGILICRIHFSFCKKRNRDGGNDRIVAFFHPYCAAHVSFHYILFFLWYCSQFSLKWILLIVLDLFTTCKCNFFLIVSRMSLQLFYHDLSLYLNLIKNEGWWGTRALEDGRSLCGNEEGRWSEYQDCNLYRGRPSWTL